MAILDKLLELQNVDKEILRVQETRQRIAQKLNRPSNDFSHAQQEARQMIEDLKRKKQRLADLHSQQADIEKQITQMEEQLGNISSMEECTILLQKLEQFRKDKDNIEQQILTQMNQNELIIKTYHEQKQKVVDLEKQTELTKQRLEKEVAECNQQIEQLRQAREKYRTQAAQADIKLLEEYERVLTRGGLPLLPVEDNSCGHCHIELLPNQTAAVITGKIITCKDCFRLLYLPKS